MPIFFFVFLFVGVIILFSSFFTVKQQTAVVVERFGKFLSIRNSGLQLKVPIIDRIAGRVNLRIQQLDVMIETQTKDNVFIKMKVSVQFKVVQEKVYEAFYKLEYPHDQITAYVFDVVRAEVPKLILDDVFAELDTSRRLQLVAATKMAEQTIITAAVESDLPADLNSTKFYVTPGQVKAGK